MTDPKEIIESAARDAVALHSTYTSARKKWLLEASRRLADTFRSGGKILVAGNGGSAADSQHLAAELVVRLSSKLDRPALPAIALTVDSSILTAGANDYGFDKIFSRQVEALGKPGDIFLGLSTSGKSPNVLEAFRIAKSGSLATFGLFGRTKLNDSTLCDLALCVPSESTMRIQEQHIFVIHLLVELTEAILYGNDAQNSRR